MWVENNKAWLNGGGAGGEGREGGRGRPRGGGEFLAHICAVNSTHSGHREHPAADAPVRGGVNPRRGQRLSRHRPA